MQPATASSASASPLLRSSRALMALEHFRIPYRVSDSSPSRGLEWVRSNGDGPALLWPGASADYGPPTAAYLDGGVGRTGIPIFARMVTDPVARAMLSAHGGDWSSIGVAAGADGERAASIWRAEDGSVFLPFDPDEAQLNYLSERYRAIMARRGSAGRKLAVRGYYRTRRLLPRPLQIALRRGFRHVQTRTRFPNWPIETGLHDFLDLFLSLLEPIAGEPVPTIAAWPNGSSWALVLTHDVETTTGLGAIDRVLELERSLALRSSWNFVPRRYDVSDETVRTLLSGGSEVGVHGLYHDGRDLESPSMLARRLPGMREAAARWGAVGFRSPATQRDWDLMPALGFDYDSSYPDTDPFEPQAGGCCTWLPFFNGSLVELPLTMQQDHTLFVILRHTDETAWVRKMDFLRSRGGMALLDTHPDYLTSDRIFNAYRRLLEGVAGDESAWKALPRDVSSWWRRRSQSHLEREDAGWTVVGAAGGEARVEFVSSRAAPRPDARRAAVGTD